ncbi:MAG: acyltransferase [Alphaproteobacteria bacterium]|nr:acyltransferase [Alphaproteobacteria bacterium]
MLPSKRFAFVDALRAIAALSVVLFHALEGDHIPIIYDRVPWLLQAIVSRANAGISIFFVLSGFVISHSLAGRALAVADVGRFMLKRSLRLDPPYWAAIAISCAIVLAKGLPMFTAWQVAAHLIYVQDLLGFEDISPIFWTLCLEVQFYFVFALLLLSRSRMLMIAAFLVSIPLSTVILWHGLFTLLWYGFLLGVGAYFAANRLVKAWMFFTYCLCLQGVAVAMNDQFMTVGVWTAIALYIVSLRQALTTAMNWRWIQFVGMISYSLYLIHSPVTGVAFRLVNMTVGNGYGAEVVGLAASLTGSILAAWAMYQLIERPSIRIARHYGANAIRANT